MKKKLIKQAAAAAASGSETSTERSCSLKPSISTRHNSQESTSCLAAKTEQQPKEFGLTKQQAEGSDDNEVPLSYASMVETMKNNGFDNVVDANRDDFWYKLFMENSNEAPCVYRILGS